MKIIQNERGFTLAELMVATMITTVILGGAVMLTSQVQQGFRRQIEDSAAEQEGRYALDWISRTIRAAGSNSFNLPPDTPLDATDDTSECPEADPAEYKWVIFDPNANGENDDIRVQTDSNPPDGLLGGVTGACDQKLEDVTVSFDPDTNSITFLDNNIGGAAAVRTDAVIDNLTFTFLKADKTAAATPAQVVYVLITVTVRTRTVEAATMLPRTRTLTQEVRIRGRGF